MKKAHKTVVAGIAVVALSAAMGVSIYGSRLVSIGAAYKAKVICSGMFVSHREFRSLLDTDVSADDLAVLRHIDVRVDRNSRAVTAEFFGLIGRTAVYRPGLGCAIIPPGAVSSAWSRAGDPSPGQG